MCIRDRPCASSRSWFCFGCRSLCRKSAGKIGGKKGTKQQKRAAGMTGGLRSGLKRRGAHRLKVRPELLDLILSGEQTLEIRSGSTRRRGWVHFSPSGTNLLVGGAKIVDCFEISRKHFAEHKALHHVPDVKKIPYKKIWGWKLEGAHKYESPLQHTQKMGAIIFQRVVKQRR